MEGFGRYVAIVMVAGLLVFFMVGYSEETLRRLQEIQIRETTDAFVEKVVEKKEILLSEWEEFNQEINRYGLLCKAELTSAERREFALGESEKSTDWFKLNYHTEIMQELYQSGKYKPVQGAYVMVKVSGKNAGVKKVNVERARKMD